MVNHQRLVHLVFLSALLLLSGCSLQPADDASGGDQRGSDQSAAGEPEARVSECPSDSPSDDFMLGLQALSEGDYAAAGQALADTLSQYPIEEDSSTADEVTDRAMLIDLVLALIAGLQQQVAELSAENTALTVDLEKREEALKRLRELTLGQPEA